MKTCLRFLPVITLLFPMSGVANSMEGMSGPNALTNGQFENQNNVIYPWTGVDRYGNLRKSVQMRGVNMFVDRSNQFDYAFMANSASFVDMNGDRLPDIVAPDGAGFFWFWKNIGQPGNPQFGFGEVMPLLVDNEQSRFRTIREKQEEIPPLTESQLRKKAEIDKRREEKLEQLQRVNEDRPVTERWAEEDLLEMIQDEYPYPWEGSRRKLGTTRASLNGYRRLRAIAAPCFWDRNGTVDFIVGDAQGNLYDARNLGTPTAPNFRTYSLSKDSLTLKLSLEYNPIDRKNEYRKIQFLNYAAPYVVDWNQNGIPDLLLGEGTYSTNVIRLYLDLPTSDPASGTFAQERVLYVGEERTFLVPSAWDWDGDGFRDLIVADANGLITIHPNPDGNFRNGLQEMESFVSVEMENRKEDLHRFTAPQPCDWNADGVMDFIWSGPFGRIFYSLGKEKGSPLFGPPTPVTSILANQVPTLSLPQDITLAAVPASRHSREGKGGTADGRRYYISRHQDRVNTDGWPEDNPWYGLIPPWNPDETFTRYQEMMSSGNFNDERFYWTGSVASYAIAPVPYEVFNLVEEAPSIQKGKGKYTLVQSWHDTRKNAVFKQPRNQLTRFGEGVSFAFNRKKGKGAKRTGDSPQELKKWMKENLHPGKIRVSFYMKLEGEFSHIMVTYPCRRWSPKSKTVAKGGQITFHTMKDPPIGRWFHYESIVDEVDLPRTMSNLYVQLLGRGEVRIRDVAVADTHRNPIRR